MKKITATVILMAVFSVFALATGESGALLLDTNSGARPAALAGILPADGDVNSMWYNPAGLALAEKNATGFTYMADLAGTNNMFLSGVIPFKGVGGLGISLAYSGAGDLSGGVEAGASSAYDMAAGLGYSQSITNSLKIGAAVKFLTSTLGTYSASSFSADLGGIYLISDTVSVQIFAKNLLGSLKYDTAVTALPSKVALGLDVKAIKTQDHVVSCMGEARYAVSDKDFGGAVAAEYTYSKVVSVRAGYSAENRSAAGFTLGAGLKTNTGIGAIAVDYAYIPFSLNTGTENRHTVTMGLEF